MLKERAREVTLMVAWVDQLLLAASFFAAYYVRACVLPGRLGGFEFVPLGAYLWLLLVSMPLFYLLFKAFRLYESLRTLSLAGIALAVAKPFLIASPVLGSLIFLLQDKTYSRSIFAGFLCLFFVVISVEKGCIKVLQSQVRGRGYNFRSVLMIGVGAEAIRITRLLQRQADLGMRVIGHLRLDGEPASSGLEAPVLGGVEDLPAVLDHRVVDEVFIAVPSKDLLRLEPCIRACEEVGVRVHLKADFVSTLLSRTYASDIEGIPILTFSSTPHSVDLMLVKRIIDVAVSLLALILLAPLFAAIALAIKGASRGPVLYRQVRSGLNGRPFIMLKFRSMFEGADREQDSLRSANEASGPVFKMRGDPRVTPLGHLLRKFSLDELPQLWNVLRGDMSLVGPRPPIPGEVERYARWQRRRLRMPPGLTCLWQINGRSRVDFETWMRLDMEYIDNWSLSLDFWILLKTIPAVLFARGAH